MLNALLALIGAILVGEAIWSFVYYRKGRLNQRQLRLALANVVAGGALTASVFAATADAPSLVVVGLLGLAGCAHLIELASRDQK